MPPRRDFFWPLLIRTLSVALGLALCIGYTYWAIQNHSQQICAQEKILATSGGATTAYDQAVKHAFQQIYHVRCG